MKQPPLQLSQAILIMVVFAFVILVASVGWAASNNLPFLNSKNLFGIDFKLQGVGRKAVFFMDAFEVGYYQDKRNSALDPLDNVAKHLEVRYFVKIPGKKLFNYNIRVMKDNYSKEELLAIADELETLKEYYIDLKDGDSYLLTYIPQIGTHFEYNGQLKGIIRGEQFAEILFAVWLGEKPFDKKIKEEILSLRDNPSEKKLTLFDLSLNKEKL